MSNLPRLRESVVESKSRLQEGREKIRLQHLSGSPGIQICNLLTDLLDSVIQQVFLAALRDLGEDGEGGLLHDATIVAHGGYGRRDVAPYSDVDLMILHHPSVVRRIEPLAKRLVADIADAGLALGFSVRTPRQTRQLAARDPIIFSSLVESRWLAGSRSLFERHMLRFRRQARRRSSFYVKRMEQARRKERLQYGETVYMLEPNIKRSSGALRDIHLMRWVGFARYGEPDPGNLRLQGHFSAKDDRQLRKASDFLLRLRNEMHFHAGRPYDVLYRGEQMRIAELWGYEGAESLLPVEQFMSEYFQHTRNVRNIVQHFRAHSRGKSALVRLITPLVTHRLERDYLVGPYHISMTRKGRARLVGSLAEILRLVDLANRTNKMIDHEVWNAIRDDVLSRDEMDVTDDAADRFLSILSCNARLGSLLKRLHELRILEKFIVGMKHARGLLQFNRYHKYTVDLHSIRAVDIAANFMQDEGPIGQVYRTIQERSMLHLALLVHDLGKGLPGDHSEVGAELSRQTAKRLRLSNRQTELIHFLVEKHLSMPHLAFRRDTSDPAIMLQFVADVGTPEKLKMLFVLSAADLAAVGPDVLTPWKTEVLHDVYRRALYQLRGGDADSDSVIEHIQHQREAVKQLFSEPDDWLANQVDCLKGDYLRDYPPEEIMADLHRLRDLSSNKSVTWGRYLPDRKVIEYAIGLHRDLSPGVFHRITGALSGQGLQILSASIQTLADGLVLDRFFVEDPDYQGEPPRERIEAVGHAVAIAVENPSARPPVFRRTWNRSQTAASPEPQMLPTRVLIDNSTLPDCTILDVFAHDRVGLLYTISRTIFELELSVKYAKIGTYLDQVVDVFYVTQLDGGKIVDESRLESIRRRLMEEIEQTSRSNNHEDGNHG